MDLKRVVGIIYYIIHMHSIEWYMNICNYIGKRRFWRQFPKVVGIWWLCQSASYVGAWHILRVYRFPNILLIAIYFPEKMSGLDEKCPEFGAKRKQCNLVVLLLVSGSVCNAIQLHIVHWHKTAGYHRDKIWDPIASNTFEYPDPYIYTCAYFFF